jgi:hypothetical protein
METKMAVEDDPAWNEWSKAFDELRKAWERFLVHQHLPNTHPDKREAWSAMQHAQTKLNRAVNKIEPAFKG